MIWKKTDTQKHCIIWILIVIRVMGYLHSANFFPVWYHRLFLYTLYVIWGQVKRGFQSYLFYLLMLSISKLLLFSYNTSHLCMCQYTLQVLMMSSLGRINDSTTPGLLNTDGPSLFFNIKLAFRRTICSFQDALSH